MDGIFFLRNGILELLIISWKRYKSPNKTDSWSPSSFPSKMCLEQNYPKDLDPDFKHKQQKWKQTEKSNKDKTAKH